MAVINPGIRVTTTEEALLFEEVAALLIEELGGEVLKAEEEEGEPEVEPEEDPVCPEMVGKMLAEGADRWPREG